jgi:hypothetical protein
MEKPAWCLVVRLRAATTVEGESRRRSLFTGPASVRVLSCQP